MVDSRVANSRDEEQEAAQAPAQAQAAFFATDDTAPAPTW